MAAVSRVLSSFDDNAGMVTINFDSVTGVVSTLALTNNSPTKTLTVTIRLHSSQAVLFTQTRTPGQGIGIFDISANGWTIAAHTPLSGLVDWEVSWG